MRAVDAGARGARLAARVLTDALAEGTDAYWQRRAEAFEKAAPRPGDFNGRATPAELAARAERCRATAAACRARASLEEHGQPIPADVLRVLQEVA